jgi:hypothetical protein
MNGVEYKNDGLHTPLEIGHAESDEKGEMKDLAESL